MVERRSYKPHETDVLTLNQNGSLGLGKRVCSKLGIDPMDRLFSWYVQDGELRVTPLVIEEIDGKTYLRPVYDKGKPLPEKI